jgi:2-oxoglutarate dehydrogenase E2 component (dihydrolipoamide succinyltransferase)
VSNIIVPQLGESVVEARITRWLKKEGDRVETGEPVVELETDKIDVEVGADHGGVISSIKRQEGEDVKVGELLAVVDEAAAATTPPSTAAGGNGSGGKTEPPAAGRATKQDLKSGLAPKDDSVIAPTRDRSIAPKVDRVIAPSPPASRTSERSEERVRMSKRRQTIARRLVEAQRTAAMLTTFNDVDMTVVMTLRERHKEAFKKDYGVSLGIASFFVKAAIAALRVFPQLNAELQDDEIVLKHYYDIGIAVGAQGGLVVPVLRDADRMSFAQIELAIRDFAKRAGDGTLTLEDLMGGTFTITNGGVFGSLLSTPILNPPQVGILGLHKIQDRAVAMNGQVVIRPMMYVALSYDHRIVDGREAVQFLGTIKEFVEEPATVLLVS